MSERERGREGGSEERRGERERENNRGLVMLACYACDVSEWERKRGRERGEKRRHEEQMRDCLCYDCLLCLLAM